MVQRLVCSMQSWDSWFQLQAILFRTHHILRGRTTWIRHRFSLIPHWFRSVFERLYVRIKLFQVIYHLSDSSLTEPLIFSKRRNLVSHIHLQRL